MTKDELDEWMRERGFVPLDDLRSPRVSHRISPEELERLHLFTEKRMKVLTAIIRDVLTNRITYEEGRRTLAETRKRDAEEFGMPSPAEESEARIVPDSDPAPGSTSQASSDEHEKAH
jgi:hypothetical protein